MHRTLQLALVAAMLAAGLLAALWSTQSSGPRSAVNSPRTPESTPVENPYFGTDGPLPQSDAEWQKVLTPEQYRIARGHGTERAFTGVYNDTKEPGVYRCVCCGQPLFTSEEKYDSGSGWPSFFRPANQDAVGMSEDNDFFLRRVEVHCSRCGAHLGHVFDDGPKPTGLRYCINSACLMHDRDMPVESDNR